MSSRGRAGKFAKAKRGGGRQFSKNLRPLDADGGEAGMWGDPADKQEDSSDDSSEDSSSEESSSEDDAPKKPAEDMTREERRAAAKAKKEAAIKKKQGPVQPGDLPSNSDDSDDGDMPANPNHSTAARKQADTDPNAPKKIKKTDDVSQLSRREREALQAQQAKERYMKLHAEGKTEEARSDLERLKLVRQQREEAAAQKAAEKEENDLVQKEKAEQMARLDRQLKQKAMRGGRGAKKGGKS